MHTGIGAGTLGTCVCSLFTNLYVNCPFAACTVSLSACYGAAKYDTHTHFWMLPMSKTLLMDFREQIKENLCPYKW